MESAGARTVNVAALVVAVPLEFLNTARYLAPFWDVVEFSMIDDVGNLRVAADLDAIARQSNDYNFALAIFELRKRS